MAKRLRRRDLVKKVRSKCEAILWLGGCIWLLHYLDFVHVVLESNKVDRCVQLALSLAADSLF